MPKMPGAIQRPIHRSNYGDKRSRTDCVILHVDAGGADTLAGLWSRANAGASSNFYVTDEGTIEQYVDSDYKTYTSKDGSWRSIGVETEGKDDGSVWTKAQCEKIAELLAWCHKTHGVPLQIMRSSRSDEKGVGYHRLGVDGNFPATGIHAGRQQRGGGELWSSSRGKTCPTDERIDQIPGIISRAQQIVDGKPLKKIEPKDPVRSHEPEDRQKLLISSKAIRQMQRVLGTKVDGVIDPVDSAAIRALQRKARMKEDGFLSKPSSLVARIQSFLNSLRDRGGNAFFRLEVDGLAGPKTGQALERYLLSLNGKFTGLHNA